MELAGLSVAQAFYKTFPPLQYKKVLVLSGPGNNGGDGLVAARHLKLLGFEPTVYYFVKGDKFKHIETQLKSFDINIYYHDKEPNDKKGEKPGLLDELSRLMTGCNGIVDAIFGFSFKPPLRAPYNKVVLMMQNSGKLVLSVDIPSGWDVDEGPNCAKISCEDEKLHPGALISLTAPKPSSEYFSANKMGPHYLGGRFVSESISKKYNFDVPEYPGVDQVVLLSK